MGHKDQDQYQNHHKTLVFFPRTFTSLLSYPHYTTTSVDTLDSGFPFRSFDVLLVMEASVAAPAPSEAGTSTAGAAPDAAAVQAATTATFVKRNRGNRGNIRKRGGDDEDGAEKDAGEEDPTQVVRKAKQQRGDPLAFSNKKEGADEEVHVTFQSSKAIQSGKDESVFRTLETETEMDRDARSVVVCRHACQLGTMHNMRAQPCTWGMHYDKAPHNAPCGLGACPVMHSCPLPHSVLIWSTSCIESHLPLQHPLTGYQQRSCCWVTQRLHTYSLSARLPSWSPRMYCFGHPRTCAGGRAQMQPLAQLHNSSA